MQSRKITGTRDVVTPEVDAAGSEMRQPAGKEHHDNRQCQCMICVPISKHERAPAINGK